MSEKKPETITTSDGYTFRKVGDVWTDGDMTFHTRPDWDLPHRECGHSECGQNYIDTGETKCARPEPL